jgi:NhaA family Na+:H+ antiporter
MIKQSENTVQEDNRSRLFKEFFNSEKTGAIILIFCTVVSVVLANSPFRENYTLFWKTDIAGHDLQHWINDGLMAVFFLLIGLELEREIYIGELSSLKQTILPLSSALGGMLIPATIYIIFNAGTDTIGGFGIPMATDIAFALSVLAILGKKVPFSLKIFLTALAIADDLGAIMVIAVFYSNAIFWTNLIIALSIFLVLIVLNRMKVQSILPYIAGGLGMWYFMSISGIHPTISGVLLAFAIPFNKEESRSPSFRIQHFLHKPVAFFILPVFALSNTAINFSGEFTGIFSQPHVTGIMLGLIVGKPLGIVLFGYAAVKMKLCNLPDKIGFSHITGVGFLAGIGFTMSIFITILAFDQINMINYAKIAILMASIISGITGYFFLKFALK